MYVSKIIGYNIYICELYIINIIIFYILYGDAERLIKRERERERERVK